MDAASFRPCILVPCYHHAKELQGFLKHLRQHGLPVLIVDDGNEEPEAALLRSLAETEGVSLLRRPVNGGKGAAMIDGFRYAAQLGYTHVLQCDADGQHDASVIPHFFRLAAEHPEHLIMGEPEYGPDAPVARMQGRKVTNFFTAVETWGLFRHDAMCGFRVYPLKALATIWHCRCLQRGMTSDMEILVRLIWQGTPTLVSPVRVSYPQGGRSNFRMVRDNVAISWLHTRLCTAMLWRMPLFWLRRLTTGR